MKMVLVTEDPRRSLIIEEEEEEESARRAIGDGLMDGIVDGRKMEDR